MVRNSDSGEVSSLHSYFNKYLVSVEQLNSLLNTCQQSSQAVPQVKDQFCSMILSYECRGYLVKMRTQDSRSKGSSTCTCKK